MHHIVTAGNLYTDIDVYGSSVALAELLRLQGEPALAASSAFMNASIPPSLRSLDVQFETNYHPAPDDIFTIVDLSDPEHFDFNANITNVVGVIDHHLGFQEYWSEKLGDKARIEFIGAACTLVYELWQESDLLDRISKASAKLLASGILDNTLNLRAKITTDRDKIACADLTKRASLPDDWAERYFSECQEYIHANIDTSIQSDAKVIQYPSLTHGIYAGQLALWNAKDFIRGNKDHIRSTMTQKGAAWYMNLIDIHAGASVFFCQDAATQQWLADLLHVQFEGDIAQANRMWLRKEIMKEALHETD